MPNNTPWTAEKDWSALAAASVPLLVSMVLGFIFKPGKWYASLNRSRASPPGWVFGVVWFIMYIFIGVAMVAACYGTDHGWTWILPVLNILLSLTFAPLMFGFHSTLMGLIVTVLCLLFGIGIIIQFATVNESNVGVGLMVPYVVWLMFASYLAWHAWEYNRCAKPVAAC